MKSLIILAIGGLTVLSSCSTVYRSGQTPDDIYYSPSREVAKGAGSETYVQANSSRDDGRRYNNQQSYRGGQGYSAYDDFATMDDRWLMMRVRNPYRWSAFDNYNYYSPFNTWGGMGMGFGGYHPGLSFGYGFYNPYSFSYYNHFNNYWNWNSYYNPYAPNIIVVNPKTNPAGYTKARSFNLNSYNNANVNRRPVTAPRADYNNSNSRPRYNNRNNNTYRVTEQSNRRVNSNNNNSRNDTYRAPAQDRPVRTYTPSTNTNTNSSSGTSSGSSGGGSGSRPSRR